jgi:hypothetical protein
MELIIDENWKFLGWDEWSEGKNVKCHTKSCLVPRKNLEKTKCELKKKKTQAL